MRLVINSQGAVHAGLRRYNGRGIFASIGRKLFSFGLKKVINAIEKENKHQLIAKSVVNGHTPLNKKKEKVTNQQGEKRKRKLSSLVSSPPSKVRKYSEKKPIQLIKSGSGIVLD